MLRTIITYDEFLKVDLRSGTVVKTENFPEARKPSYKVWVDFGSEIGILQTSAQITKRYTHDSLMGRAVCGVINLDEKDIAGFKSQFLLVGFEDVNGDVCLMTIDPRVHNGKRMF